MSLCHVLIKCSYTPYMFVFCLFSSQSHMHSVSVTCTQHHAHSYTAPCTPVQGAQHHAPSTRSTVVYSIMLTSTQHHDHLYKAPCSVGNRARLTYDNAELHLCSLWLTCTAPMDWLPSGPPSHVLDSRYDSSDSRATPEQAQAPAWYY